MDQIVAQALTLYGKIVGVKRKEASVISAPARPATSVIYPMHLGNGKTNGTKPAATTKLNGSTNGGTRITNIDSVS